MMEPVKARLLLHKRTKSLQDVLLAWSGSSGEMHAWGSSRGEEVASLCGRRNNLGRDFSTSEGPQSDATFSLSILGFPSGIPAEPAKWYEKMVWPLYWDYATLDAG